MTPAKGGDTTTAWGISGKDSVQAAQRGQVKARTVKRPAANILLGFPSKGKPKRSRAARLANKRLLPRTRKLSPLCTTSLSLPPQGAPVPRGGLGGRSRIEFIVSPLLRRRHNESHFAAQSPERAFLAKPFFARAKNGVNSGRRSLKISVGKTKPDSEPSPLRGRLLRKNTGRINFSPCVNRIQFLLSELTGRPDIILSASRMSFSTLSRRV